MQTEMVQNQSQNQNSQDEQIIKLELPLEPLPWQEEVEADDHRFKVVVAGRRSGKSVFSLNQLVVRAGIKPNSLNWYVAPTYGMAKAIAWDTLKYFLADFRKWNLITKQNDSELLIKFRIGSIIQLKGADNPDSLRGVGPDFLVLDEYATMKKEVWTEVLRPAVTDKQGDVLFIGTPQGYNHFYDLYQMELREPGFWKSWKLKTSDAGCVPQEEIDQAKRDMDERAFRQEFEASFETFGGQVFATFDRHKYAGKEFEFQNQLEFDLGMDFGWAAPTAVLFIQVDAEENVYVFDEIGVRETPITRTGQMIREKEYKRFWEWPEQRATLDPDQIYCDPAGDSKNEALGTSSVEELKRIGFKVTYKKNYPGIIQDRINQIRKWLKNRKLIIHPRCINLIKAFEMYRYPEPKNDVRSEIPLKDGVSDHWIDALGYFFINRFPVKKSVIGAM